MLDFKQRRGRRHLRIKTRVRGTADIPRLVVSRSLKYLNCQFIDDTLKKTILSLSDRTMDVKKSKLPPTAKAKILGDQAAAVAQQAGISRVVFDRAGYKYHGRVKAFAEAARAGGLKF